MAKCLKKGPPFSIPRLAQPSLSFQLTGTQSRNLQSVSTIVDWAKWLCTIFSHWGCLWVTIEASWTCICLTRCSESKLILGIGYTHAVVTIFRKKKQLETEIWCPISMLTKSLPDGLEVPDLKSVQCTPSNSIPPWLKRAPGLTGLSVTSVPGYFRFFLFKKKKPLKFELHNMHRNGQRFSAGYPNRRRAPYRRPRKDFKGFDNWLLAAIWNKSKTTESPA